MKTVLQVAVYTTVLVASLLYITDRVKVYDIFGHTVTVIK